MEASLSPEAKWDPYDYGLLCNPHNAFRTIRENFPLYYNEEYDFYALSRYEDCIWGLSDRDILRNGKGVMLEQIRSGVPMPRGLFNFEDPPVHTLHRGLLSRVFTPNRMAQLEPQIREFCARTLDPLKNAEGFDFVRDLSSKVPMRVAATIAESVPRRCLHRETRVLYEAACCSICRGTTLNSSPLARCMVPSETQSPKSSTRSVN